MQEEMSANFLGTDLRRNQQRRVTITHPTKEPFVSLTAH
jgi:hypothetical protein